MSRCNECYSTELEFFEVNWTTEGEDGIIVECKHCGNKQHEDGEY